jgi:hypothetical protein
MRHQTKDKGDLGVAKTIPHLLDYDIRCCVPLSEHLPFDLIAVMPDFTTLRRVQVKYRKQDIHGSIVLTFRSNYYDSKRIYSKRVDFDEIDAYCLYCPDTDKTYYLRINEIPSQNISVTMRVASPKNGQKTKIWYAKEFTDPRRLAPSNTTVAATRRDVSELDEQANAKVIAYLVEQGIQPLIAMSQFLPFDMIAVMPDMKTLKRVRVGWGDVETTPYADQYAIYDPYTKQCAIYEASNLPGDLRRVKAAEIGEVAG